MQIYLIINHLHWGSEIFPYLYIGSDSKDRKHYMGSCKSLSSDIENHGSHQFSKIILWQGSFIDLKNMGFPTLTALENTFHESLSVVSDNKFYNAATAHGKFHIVGRGNFYYLTDPFKKIVSLPIDHPDVIAGLVVGMNFGKRFNISEDSIRKRRSTSMIRYGVDHPCKSNIVRSKLKTPKSTETKNKMKGPKSAEHKANMKKPKSESHKQKMSQNHKNNTIVDQLTETGIVIGTFPTIKNAAQIVYPHLNFLSSRTAIGQCCRKKREKYNGFRWKYSGE